MVKQHNRSRLAALAIAATVALGAAACVPPPGPDVDPPDDRSVITDDAHLDVVSIELHGDHFHVGIDHADHEEQLHPEDVVLAVGHPNESIVGDDPGFAPLGAAGTPIWTLDGGWSVHGAAAGDLVDDTVTMHVRSISGPGTLGVWSTDGLGVPAFQIDSGAPLPQSLELSHHAHAHRNWSFTEPGEYTVGIEVTGVMAATGEELTSGVQTWTFRVEDHDH